MVEHVGPGSRARGPGMGAPDRGVLGGARGEGEGGRGGWFVFVFFVFVFVVRCVVRGGSGTGTTSRYARPSGHSGRPVSAKEASVP